MSAAPNRCHFQPEGSTAPVEGLGDGVGVGVVDGVGVGVADGLGLGLVPLPPPLGWPAFVVDPPDGLVPGLLVPWPEPAGVPPWAPDVPPGVPAE
jgi:hypothetical protein